MMTSKAYGKSRLHYAFMAPAIALILLIYIIPMICGILISLTDWNGIGWNFNFVGLKNYIEILGDGKTRQILGNNLVYFVMLVVVQNILALLIALLINKKLKGSSFFKAAIFSPAVIATVAVGFIWVLIYDPVSGPLVTLAKNYDLGFLENFGWLGDMNASIILISLTSMWQWTGYNMVIYLAGLQSIPDEIYEAGDIDGTNSLQKFFYITLPMLVHAITINIVLSTISVLKIFDLPFVMTRGGPGYATTSLAIRIYTSAFGETRMGYGAAMSIILFVFVLVIAVVQTWYFRKREKEIY